MDTVGKLGRSRIDDLDTVGKLGRSRIEDFDTVGKLGRVAAKFGGGRNIGLESSSELDCSGVSIRCSVGRLPDSSVSSGSNLTLCRGGASDSSSADVLPRLSCTGDDSSSIR